MKLLAEEQVLQDEALSATEGGTEGGQKEADEFEHRGRIADQAPDEIAVRPWPNAGALDLGK